MQSPTTFDETDARRILLVQAVETTDPKGRLISDAERREAEDTVLAAERRRELRVDAARFLRARAAELSQVLESRAPRLARLEERDPLWVLVGWAMPALALLAGFGSDRAFNWERTDLLSLPLIGVIAWNFAVYAWVAAGLVQPRKDSEFLQKLTEIPSRFATRAAVQFRMLWWRAAGALETARLARVLHLSAALWAVGVALSILVKGVGTRFRVGWESTWLNANAVHAILEVMSLPARAFGMKPFTLNEVRQLEFGSGTAATQSDAQVWALTYISFLIAVVVVPRLLLWGIATFRERRLGRSVTLDISGTYFETVLARAMPASVSISLRGNDTRLLDLAMEIVRQSSHADRPGGTARLTSREGDELRCEVGGGSADYVWLVTPNAALSHEEQLIVEGVASPVLLLCPYEDAAATLRQSGHPHVLSLQAVGASWAAEEPLHEWLVDHAPARKKAGMRRLIDAWNEHQQQQFRDALACMANALAASIRDSETVGMFPGGKARDTASAALLARIQSRVDAMHERLLETYRVRAVGVGGSIEASSALGGVLGQTGSGLAGAAAGALAGLKIDLALGGLAMGLGVATGALVGAGAFAAARWWLMGGVVQLGDDQVQDLVELVVLQYLAVIHAGRINDRPEGAVPAAWKSESIAAFAGVAAELRKAIKLARESSEEEPKDLVKVLRDVTSAVLAALRAKPAPGGT